MKHSKDAGEVMESDLANAIVAHDRARRRREAAEEAEEAALVRVIGEAEHFGRGGVREIARMVELSPATITRRKAREALRPGGSVPGMHYDEDEWIAADDALWAGIPEELSDRGPYRVEWTEQGRSISWVGTGTVRLDLEAGTSTFDPSTGEPIQGITEAEYADLRDHGVDTPSRARVARRLTRAVLRTLHPTIQRTGAIVDVATPAVLADISGAYAIVTHAVHEVVDVEHQAALRMAQSQGVYLGLAD